MLGNWKYNNWKNKQIDRDDVEAYIGYEIYPEDIEIFSNILYPDFMEYKNCIIKLPSNCSPQELKDIQTLFDNWENEKLSITEIEKIMNYTAVSDIFFNNSNNSNFSTLKNVANVIKFNWELWLERNFPNKKFNVITVNNEDGDEISLTFFQISNYNKP